MKYVEIIGGLGNQMFQYALYLTFKRIYGAENVKIVIDRFDEVLDNQGYELKKVFGIEEEEAIIPKKDVKTLIDDKTDIFSKLRRKLFGSFRTYKSEGDNLSYKSNVFIKEPHPEIYYSGCWQSELYFKKYKNEILDKFEFVDKLDVENEKVALCIKNSNSVSVHIRRGDYINNPFYKNILGEVCDNEYYHEAIKIIESKDNNLEYYVFSDDIEWVKNNIVALKDKKVIYVNWNKAEKSYIDMQLMSLCKHNIIANSTFSWWGAWLNQNDNKIVIGPKKWFKSKKKNNDIIPSNWLKI